MLTDLTDNILLLSTRLPRSSAPRRRSPPGPCARFFPLIANVTIFPADAFPSPLFYVSNRNISPNVTDPCGDTIAIFETVNGTGNDADCTATTNARPAGAYRAEVGGKLSLVVQILTGLQQIRSMPLGRVDDSGDQFIIAGAGPNAESGVAVFLRVDGGRTLTLIARNVDLQNRTSFVFSVEARSP
ncbi:hypothetical protein B0H11DRAFT_1867171 [Mycena galericulata]|nr:hypothetical protein B0H11DRAFT_1867171 [Mycena galericulata]